MAIADQADLAKILAAELLRYTASRYPDVDAPTAWRALVLAAADLREIARTRNREHCWVDAVPPRQSANPWQIEYE
jgi:hypothetical protein